jgi:hypothetical protein
MTIDPKLVGELLAGYNSGNSRNGASKKKLEGDFGSTGLTTRPAIIFEDSVPKFYRYRLDTPCGRLKKVLFQGV